MFSVARRSVAIFAALATTAFQAAPTFDVASVKPNATLGGERGAGFQPGGRFRARNMTVRGLIAAAYGDPQPIPSFRVVGGPGWIDSDRFDIDARAEGNLTDMPNQPGWSPRGQLMLRALLADRFKMVARQEQRDSPAYALVLLKAGAPLGPQLRVSDGSDCLVRAAGAPPPPADAITCGGFRFTPPERISGRGLTMDDIARYLMLNTGLDRPIANRTGLDGRYSFELDFTRNAPPPPAPGALDAAAPSGTSIFTAVREQLGLRLDVTRAPLDVVVIDSIERPTPD